MFFLSISSYFCTENVILKTVCIHTSLNESRLSGRWYKGKIEIPKVDMYFLGETLMGAHKVILNCYSAYQWQNSRINSDQNQKQNTHLQQPWTTQVVSIQKDQHSKNITCFIKPQTFHQVIFLYILMAVKQTYFKNSATE